MPETIREASAGAYEAKDGIAPPAYLLSLSVSNFRCFGPKQTLDLSDGNGRPAQWTVLLGENGVGKTTLLQCAAAMQAREDISSDGSNKYPVKMYAPIGFQNSSTEFNFLFGKPTNFRKKKSITTNQDISINVEIHTGLRIADRTDEGQVSKYNIEGNRLVRNAIYLPEIANLIMFGYGAIRRSGKLVLSNAVISDTCKTLFDADAELISAEEWLLQTNYASIIGSNPQKRLAKVRLLKVKTLLTEILPDVTDFNFGTSDDAVMTPRVEAKTPYGWVRITNLSLGYKTALTWMVDFASRLFDRYPDSPNPLAEPAICLVDEIDLHLHPRWQRELVQRLTETFPNTQFIVTAHSPLIVQAAPNANLALLRREGDHVVIDNDVDEIRNWRVDQILTSDLFGLSSARPPSLDAAFDERQRILSQPALSDADRHRLGELETEISGKMPLGETPSDIRAMDALRLAAAALDRKNRK